MTRGRRLLKLAAILFAAAGMMTATISQASAATGAGGLPILYASAKQQAHECNVISLNDSSYQAVVCSDIETYEYGSYYYAYGQEEAICQTTSTHTVVPCSAISEDDLLAAGDATNTGAFWTQCGLGTSYGYCPDGRMYVYTRNWVYKVGNAEGGVCSSNAGSSYDLWNVGLNGSTWIITPDGKKWTLGVNGTSNDGGNESSGHNYICP
jgi:hypothetical protein